MKLNGEISEEEEEKVVVVGYALTSKKKKSFLKPNFIALARNKGIFFVAIDLNKPLLEQGPFDVVLHKLPGKEWREIIEVFHYGLLTVLYPSSTGWPRIWAMTNLVDSLKSKRTMMLEKQCHCPPWWGTEKVRTHCGSIDFRHKHPEVTILDPPDAIQHLLNRQSMLQNVAELNLSDCHGKVGVPQQLVITKNPSTILYEVTKAGMKLPLVAKPLVVDGSAKSHELCIAYDEVSLSKLEPPLVLQEFVNHGGLLFKIYIVGETIKVVRRFSLPNVCKHELLDVDGLFRLPRVSCAAASADDADLDPNIAEHPPRPLLERLARDLRCRLGLRLFNIDMIREHGTKDVFYVIDINYFPGYGKMPEYEHIFIDFLLSLVQNKCKKRDGT